MRRLVRYAGIVWCLILLLGLVVSVQARTVQGRLTMVALDVGQGDALFVTLPDGQQMVVDGGPDGQLVQKIGRYMPYFDRKIELVVLSHPHADHVNGLVGLLQQYEVGRVVMSGAEYTNAGYRELRAEIERRAIPVSYVARGDRFDFGADTHMRVLHPAAVTKDQKFSDVHESTVVTRLTFGRTELLLTGDIDTEIEAELVKSGEILDADVLKVSHHGSKYSTSAEFLRAVDPEIAVISVAAKNRYGHPHPELLQRLTEYPDLQVRRTDQGGDITLISDGNTIQ